MDTLASHALYLFSKSSTETTSTGTTTLTNTTTNTNSTDTHGTEHGAEHGEPQVVVFALFFFAISGAFIRHFFKRVPLPYTVILVIYGFLMGAAVAHDKTHDFFRTSIESFAGMNGHVVLFVFLPPLLFESSFALDQEIFWKVKWQVIVLAGPGLAIATFLTGAMVHPLLKGNGWTFVDALDWSHYCCHRSCGCGGDAQRAGSIKENWPRD